MKIDPSTLDFRKSHELLLEVTVPRPIAFVSTVGADGVFNVAPFSLFTVLSAKPPMICLGIGRKRDGQKKDTLKNIEFSRDFVVNIVNEALAEAMNQSSAEYPSDVDEFKEVGLTPVKSDLAKAPMVGESPISMECRVVQIIEFGDASRYTSIVIGEVIQIHINDDILIDGKIQASKLRAVGRLGGEQFCRTTDIFEMKRAYIP